MWVSAALPEGGARERGRVFGGGRREEEHSELKDATPDVGRDDAMRSFDRPQPMRLNVLTAVSSGHVPFSCPGRCAGGEWREQGGHGQQDSYAWTGQNPTLGSSSVDFPAEPAARETGHSHGEAEATPEDLSI